MIYNPDKFYYHSTSEIEQGCPRILSTTESLKRPVVIGLRGLPYQQCSIPSIFQVHVRTEICGKISCPCGITVREGADVIVVSNCDEDIPNPRFASNIKHQKEITVERSRFGGSDFLVSGCFRAFTIDVDCSWWEGVYRKLTSILHMVLLAKKT